MKQLCEGDVVVKNMAALKYVDVKESIYQSHKLGKDLESFSSVKDFLESEYGSVYVVIGAYLLPLYGLSGPKSKDQPPLPLSVIERIDIKDLRTGEIHKNLPNMLFQEISDHRSKQIDQII